MKSFACILATIALIAAGNACARDPQIINQAGMYEQTLKFYLHPAYSVDTADSPRQLGKHPAVLVKEREARQAAQAAPSAQRVHPVLTLREPHASLATWNP